MSAHHQPTLNIVTLMLFLCHMTFIGTMKQIQAVHQCQVTIACYAEILDLIGYPIRSKISQMRMIISELR